MEDIFENLYCGTDEFILGFRKNNLFTLLNNNCSTWNNALKILKQWNILKEKL